MTPEKMATSVEIVHGSGARMAGLADESIQLVITSPPYFPATMESRLNNGIGDAAVRQMEVELESFAFTLRPVFAECFRVLRPGGRMILQTRDVRLRQHLVPVESIHRQACEGVGFRLYSRHFWRPLFRTRNRDALRESMGMTVGPTPYDPEVFLVLIKPGSSSPPTGTPEDVRLLSQDVIVSSPGRLRRRHRFQAPLPVLRAMIRTYSAPGEIVMDPFAGGGTTLVVARELGRSAWGCDVDPEAVALMRSNLPDTLLP